jgi:hypothetical protein
MKILPLTSAQELYKSTHKVPQQRLKNAGLCDTMPKRIITWLQLHGKLRYTELAQKELEFRQETGWQSDSFTSIGTHISNLNPHFQGLLSDMQINGHIQKVLIDNIKYYMICQMNTQKP